MVSFMRRVVAAARVAAAVVLSVLVPLLLGVVVDYCVQGHASESGVDLDAEVRDTGAEANGSE
jgi:hypothetical protein